MSKKFGGLGKGLGAFGLGASTQSQAKPIASSAQGEKITDSDGKSVVELEIEKISANPNQPRRKFDQEALSALEESISQYGVLQPVLVRRTVKGYELIAGERRLRAARQAGNKTIPALIREYNDAQMTEVALIENIQRENLNAIEEAKAYRHLLSDYGLTQEMLSAKVGRSRSHIANFLRLLRLSPKVQEMLSTGTISMGQAKPLLGLEEAELQDKAAEYIVASELSARRAEALVKHLQKDACYLDRQEKAAQEPAGQDIFYRQAQDKLKLLLGTNVRIRQKGKKQRLEIDFVSEEDLGNLILLLEQLGSHQQDNGQELSKEARLSMLRQYSTTGKLHV